MYRALMRFLESLEIPILTTLRDSQNYVRAAETGMGIFEMKPYLVREDMDQWLPLLGWLAKKEGTTTGLAPQQATPQPTQQAPAAPLVPSAPTNVTSDWEFLSGKS
jgi:chromosome partitioning protein